MDFSQNKMQETVTNKTERKSLFSSFLDVLEAKEKQAQADRQLQEEKYLRRTQRIYDFHERQRAEALEVRRCLELVSSHARVLEGVLRGAERADSQHAPLSAALGAHAAATARAMAAVLRDAAAIRHRLSEHSQRHMDTLLAKMETELGVWRAFVQRAVDVTNSAETTRDNVHNLIAEQRRVVRDVCASAALAALSAPATPTLSPPPAITVPSTAALTPSPAPPHDSANACSTPIQHQ